MKKPLKKAIKKATKKVARKVVKNPKKKKPTGVELKKSLLHFSLTQQNAIRQGTAVRMQLQKTVDEALEREDANTYVYSLPGFGKTFTVIDGLFKRRMEHHIISGNTSMFAFCLRLAVIDSDTPKGEKITIVVDDCDEILKNEANINIIKSILEKPKMLHYEKSMAGQRSALNQKQINSIDEHANPNGLGFLVDCSNMKFIFTSNKKLPTKLDVEKKPSALNNHLHAIRSRCFTEDFNHSWEVMWGWLVDIVLTKNVENVNKLTPEQKLVMLDWMFTNWRNMKEASIRTCSKMALTMLASPKDFKTSWELSYLN